jgi:DNA-binding protein YbaB
MNIRLSKYPVDEEQFESTLRAVKGIISISIDKKTAMMVFDIDPEFSDDEADIIRAIVAAVRENGGEVYTEKRSYPVLNIPSRYYFSSKNATGFTRSRLRYDD